MFINIELRSDIAALLQAQVAAGRFTSIGEAVAALALDDAAALMDLDQADLNWARPFIAKGLADQAAGRMLPAEDVHAELRARVALPLE